MLLWALACPALTLAQSRPYASDWDDHDEEPDKGGHSMKRRTLEPELEGLRNLDWPLAMAVVGGGTALGLGVLVVLHKRRHRPRLCARCHRPRTLLHEQEDDYHLDPGEQVEEQLGSVDYDVWWCEHCHDTEVLPHRPLITPYVDCDRCRYTTVKESTTPLPRGRFGQRYVRVTLTCQHCHHTTSFTRRIDDP